MAALKLQPTERLSRVDRYATAGLQRLLDYQHDDGGWGWWKTDENDPFMTAYVVAGLAQAKAAGVPVAYGFVEKGAEWIKKDLAADPKLNADLRAYMVYALTVAGQGDAALLNQVYSRRSNLSPYGMALLGLALEQTKDNRAGEVAAAGRFHRLSEIVGAGLPEPVLGVEAPDARKERFVTDQAPQHVQHRRAVFPTAPRQRDLFMPIERRQIERAHRSSGRPAPKQTKRSYTK